MIHRVASSEKYSSGLYEIETKWSLADIHSANMVLDALLEAENKLHKKAKANTP